MILGVFLAIGESLTDFKNKGQVDLFIRQNLTSYAHIFDRVYVFSYQNEKFADLKNISVLPNKWNTHRYFYSLMLPFIHYQKIKECNMLRGMQISGGIPGVVASILFRKPLVVNYGYRYTEFAKKEGKYLQALFYHLISPIVLFCTTQIIVPTKSLMRDLKAWRKKIVIIPNGVDTNKFKPPRTRKKRLSPINVLFVGRLDPIKNLESLVTAISLLPQKIILILVGVGAESDKLILLGKKLGVRLIIKGPVGHNKLPPIFREASIFVLPSLEEGHPKALLEAMAVGLPVVGTKVRGITDVINNGENGLLSDTTPVAIARAIQKIITNHRLAQKLGRNARLWVEKNCSLETTRTLEIKLLSHLAKEKL